MISSVEVQNASGLIQSFEIDNSDNGYQIRDIEGLNPVRANLVSTGFANMDGEQYQSSRREKRNLILTIGLVPDFVNTSVSNLRHNLYAFFMPKSVITMRFFRTDGVPVRISGRVETFDAPIFTRDPQVSISIVCFDPDFLADEIVVPGTSIQFPTFTPINYEGSVSTGILLELNVTASIDGFTATVIRPGGTGQALTYSGGLIAGDVVTLSTTPGDKFINRLRGSTLTSILAGVSPYSTWLDLDSGLNEFGVFISTPTPQSYNLKYRTRLGGL